MQDNASIHTARIVQRWLRNWARTNQVELLAWPPYSPDLNPEENLWKLLKDGVGKDHQYLREMPNSEASLASLDLAVDAAWRSIRETVLLNLAESMPRRLEAVIAAEGWHTKY
jgi:transposase